MSVQQVWLFYSSSPCEQECHSFCSVPAPSLLVPHPLASDVPVVSPLRVTAALLPVGMGVADWEEFGQCMCIDWFPGNKRMKMAAGYSNGRPHPQTVVAL